MNKYAFLLFFVASQILSQNQPDFSLDQQKKIAIEKKLASILSFSEFSYGELASAAAFEETYYNPYAFTISGESRAIDKFKKRAISVKYGKEEAWCEALFDYGSLQVIELNVSSFDRIFVTDDGNRDSTARSSINDEKLKQLYQGFPATVLRVEEIPETLHLGKLKISKGETYRILKWPLFQGAYAYRDRGLFLYTDLSGHLLSLKNVPAPLDYRAAVKENIDDNLILKNIKGALDKQIKTAYSQIPRKNQPESPPSKITELRLLATSCEIIDVLLDNKDIQQRLVLDATIEGKTKDEVFRMSCDVDADTGEVLAIQLITSHPISKTTNTKLFSAIKEGDIGLVKSLLESGVDPNTREPSRKDGLTSNLTALMYAAIYCNVDIAGILIEKGADTNASDKIGQTALMVAAESRGGEKMIKLLLGNKAIINAVNNEGETALFYAAGCGEPRNVKLLVDSGIDISIINKSGRSPLFSISDAMIFEDGRSVTIAKYLIDSGIDIDLVDGDGESALHFAVQNENLPIVRFLIARKANVNIKNEFGETPLDIAEENGYDEIRKLLRKAGARD